jgi:hypothetical protein
VDHSTQHVDPLHRRLATAWLEQRQPGPTWRLQVQAAVRSYGVVVPQVFGQHPAPSPHWPSRPPSPWPPNCTTAPIKPTNCAPPPCNEPATTPTWPAAATHRDAQDAYQQAADAATGALSDAQKARIHQLVSDLPTLFNDPNTPHRERKRMARLLLTDVTATRTADTITCHARLPGGQHHTLTLPTLKPAWLLRKTPPQVVAAIDDLLNHHTHTQIADILNNRGLTSGEGRPFHRLIIARIVRISVAAGQQPRERERVGDAQVCQSQQHEAASSRSDQPR